jgi:hypothetical protein
LAPQPMMAHLMQSSLVRSGHLGSTTLGKLGQFFVYSCSGTKDFLEKL